MTEDEARKWLTDQFDVSRETWERLERFVGYLRREAAVQNLVSASTLDHVWARHVVDSAQLLRFAPAVSGRWIDLGSGAGFPGIIIALLSAWPVTLVESRAKRIEYLSRAVEMLDLESQVEVAGTTLEKVTATPYAVISARAVAPLPKLLDLASRFSTNKTIWLLPKGRNAAMEGYDARNGWNFDMRIEPSVTDIEAGILVGTVCGRVSQTAKQPRKGQKRV